MNLQDGMDQDDPPQSKLRRTIKACIWGAVLALVGWLLAGFVAHYQIIRLGKDAGFQLIWNKPVDALRLGNTLHVSHHFGFPQIDTACAKSRDRFLQLDGWLGNATAVGLSEFDVDRDVVRILKRSASLKTLSLHAVPLTPEVVDYLCDSPQISVMDLSFSTMDDASIHRLSSIQATGLQFRFGNQLASDTRFHLPSQVVNLFVYGDKTPSHFIEDLGKMKQLQTLTLMLKDHESKDLSILCSLKSLKQVQLIGPNVNNASLDASCITAKNIEINGIAPARGPRGQTPVAGK